MRKIYLFVVPLVFAAFFALAAQEQENKGPDRGFSLRNSLGGIYNPVGASFGTKVFYTEPLYGDREGILWESARLEMGINNNLSPAYDDLSIELFVEPVAVFDVRTNIGFRYAYDALGHGFTAMEGYDEAYSSEEREDKTTKSATGLFIHITPRIKVPIGPLFLLNAFSWEYYSFDAGDNDFFYEPSNDFILKESDSLIKNVADLVYQMPLDNGVTLTTGLEYELRYVPGSGDDSHKLSLLGVAQVPVPQKGMEFDFALLLGHFIENEYYDADNNVYFSPALQIGMTKEL